MANPHRKFEAGLIIVSHKRVSTIVEVGRKSGEASLVTAMSDKSAEHGIYHTIRALLGVEIKPDQVKFVGAPEGFPLSSAQGSRKIRLAMVTFTAEQFEQAKLGSSQTEGAEMRKVSLAEVADLQSADIVSLAGIQWLLNNYNK